MKGVGPWQAMVQEADGLEGEAPQLEAEAEQLSQKLKKEEQVRWVVPACILSHTVSMVTACNLL